MSARRFKLLKDLPDVKAGTELIWEQKKYGGEYTVLGDSPTMSNYYHFNQFLVEDNPEWFEEVFDVVSVDDIEFDLDEKWIKFHFRGLYKAEQVTSIKKSLEQLLNSNPFSSSTPSGTANGVLNTDEDGVIIKEGDKRSVRFTATIYDEEDLKKAFEAGREFHPIASELEKLRWQAKMCYNFDSPQDYINSLHK